MEILEKPNLMSEIYRYSFSIGKWDEEYEWTYSIYRDDNCAFAEKNVSRVDEIPDLTAEEEEALRIYLNSISK